MWRLQSLKRAWAFPDDDIARGRVDPRDIAIPQTGLGFSRLSASITRSSVESLLQSLKRAWAFPDLVRATFIRDRVGLQSLKRAWAFPDRRVCIIA